MSLSLSHPSLTQCIKVIRSAQPLYLCHRTTMVITLQNHSGNTLSALSRIRRRRRRHCTLDKAAPCTCGAKEGPYNRYVYPHTPAPGWQTRPTASHSATMGSWAMRQRILGSHTPPCHRRMVITTQFSVMPCRTAAQTSSVPLQVAFDGALALAICASVHMGSWGGGCWAMTSALNSPAQS